MGGLAAAVGFCAVGVTGAALACGLAGTGLAVATTFLAATSFLVWSTFAATGFDGRLAWTLAGCPFGAADLTGEGLCALSLRTAALLVGFCVALLLEVFFRAMSLVSLATSGCSFSITHATLFLSVRASAHTTRVADARRRPDFTPQAFTGPGLLGRTCPSRLCCMAWLPKTAHRHTRTSVCQMAPLRSDTAYFADLSSDFVQAVTTENHHNTNFTHFEGSRRKEHTPWHARCLNTRHNGCDL